MNKMLFLWPHMKRFLNKVDTSIKANSPLKTSSGLGPSYWDHIGLQDVLIIDQHCPVLKKKIKSF